MSTPTDPSATPAPSTDPVALHVLPESSTFEPGLGMCVGGVALVELAERFGTPLFVYDEAQLRARCREAVAAFGSGAAFATKSFLCKAMAALAAAEGMLLDVSTGGELEIALAAGVAPGRLVLHGNNKSEAELVRALEVGIGRIVVDSFDEIDRLARLVSPGIATRMSIRVTPGVEAHTHEYVMTGQEDSKFGFSIAAGAADSAIEALRQLVGEALDGAHAHIGSQIFRLDAFEREVGALAPLVSRHQLGELSLGGGLGVAYLNREEAPSITEWAEVVIGACRSAGIDESVALGVEPGRSIVARAGLTLYRVGTIKTLPGIRTYVAVDGGMSDNPRPVLYGSGYEAFLPRAPRAPRDLACRVVGKHCESGDVIVADARLPESVAVGDVLCTPVTGAYGFAMASNYNRLGRPAVVFVDGGEAREVVRRESVFDLLRLEP
jgi:diaminopimelate decarboxylase